VFISTLCSFFVLSVFYAVTRAGLGALQ
jgi:hypothetical protein